MPILLVSWWWARFHQRINESGCSSFLLCFQPFICQKQYFPWTDSLFYEFPLRNSRLRKIHFMLKKPSWKPLFPDFRPFQWNTKIKLFRAELTSWNLWGIERLEFWDFSGIYWRKTFSPQVSFRFSLHFCVWISSRFARYFHNWLVPSRKFHPLKIFLPIWEAAEPSGSLTIGNKNFYSIGIHVSDIGDLLNRFDRFRIRESHWLKIQKIPDNGKFTEWFNSVFGEKISPNAGNHFGWLVLFRKFHSSVDWKKITLTQKFG